MDDARPPEPAVRPASAAELESWDAGTVHAPRGDVFQSIAWGLHRRRRGWQPHFLVANGGPVLALVRKWPLIGGGSAYVSRGPIPGPDPVVVADRLSAVVDWLGARGIDVVAADPEMPAESGFGDLLQQRGFRRIEDIQPSRHRQEVDLPGDADEPAVLKSFNATTRNLIRGAERQGLRVRRIDRREHPAFEDFVEGSPAGVSERTTLQRLYQILAATARRRSFRLAPWATFVDWTEAGIAAGHVACLVVERGDGEPITGATFYRHGERLSYAVSGEREELRRAHPGAVRLLLWRAIQLACREGRRVMDLGGVDVRGARRMPQPGEPAYGLFQFKQSFGARWLELSGAHERVISHRRYAAGRVLARLPLDR